MRRKAWVVYAKPPFGSPEQVLKYLARYTHRVAISNSRIVSVTDTHVTFRYRDRKRGNVMRTMTLDGVEFLRRFLLHLLPKGFVRIRHFGLLANRGRREKLAQCRALLGVPTPAILAPTAIKLAPEADVNDDADEPEARRCPSCGVGRLSWIQQLYPSVPPCAPHPAPSPPDTS